MTIKPSGPTIDIAASGGQIVGDAPGETINGGQYGNNTILTYQAADSYATVNLGSGINNTVYLHSYDTINASTGPQTIYEYAGHDNTFNLGDGNFTLGLTRNDVVHGGDGNNRVQRYAAGADNHITLGNGNNTIDASSGDAIVVGDGNNTVNLGAANSGVLTLGNGDNLVYGTPAKDNVTAIGNFTVKVGTGDDTCYFNSSKGGSLTLDSAAGAHGLLYLSLQESTFDSVQVTIHNRSSIIYSDDNTHIANFGVHVAVDGYKAPYEASVDYVATSEAIAAPYNIAQPLPYFISDLLFDPVNRWSTMLGIGATVPTLHFSMMQTLPANADATDAKGFVPVGQDLPVGYSPQQLIDANAQHAIALNAAQLSAVTALANWAAVADVHFVSAQDADGVQIRFGENTQLDSGGYAPTPYVTPEGVSNFSEGDIYLGKNSISSTYFNAGQYGGTIWAHEIGHTLGLGGESGNSDIHDVLPFGEDTGANTVESYSQHFPYPNGPQVFDIATVQYLYGPNPDFHPNASRVWSFNLAGGAGNVIMDGNGSLNTISAAGAQAAAVIDLRQGHWSHLGPKSDDVLAANQLFIDYGSTVNAAVGGDGHDTIICNDNKDSIACGNGGATVVTAGGDGTIAGGSGVDTVVFADARANYSLINLDGTISVKEVAAPAQRATLQGTYALSHVERLQFADVAVALDIDGHGGQAYRIYQAAFNRTPDSAGVGYWIGAMDKGASLTDVASGFVNSPEFKAAYGDTPTDADMLGKFYANVLHRAPDPAGFDYWLGVLDSKGATPAQVLASFSESPENQATLIGVIGNGFVYTPFTG